MPDQLWRWLPLASEALMLIFWTHSPYRWRMAEWLRDRHHHIGHHKHHQFHVVLFVNGVGTLLTPGQRTKEMIELTLGHFVECTLAYLDANGNPMLVTPKVDSPPVWTQTTPATDKLVVSADGLTAEAQTLAVGADSLGVTVIVSGV